MPSNDLRGRFNDLLIENVGSCRYPSKEIMDRVELTLGDSEHAAKYAEVLFSKITKYPSLHLLDRISGLVSRIEWAERQASAEEG
jgi:hypothetical protein